MIEGNEVSASSELDEVTGDLVVAGSHVVVVDQDGYDDAAKFCEKVKERIKAVQAFFSPLKIKANAAHKAITSEENNKLKPLNDIFNTVEGARSEWFKEEERKIRCAEAEAKKKEADANRLEELEQIAEDKDDEAGQARQRGDEDVAEQVEQDAEDAKEQVKELKRGVADSPKETTPAPPAPRASAGTKMRRTWKGRVTNMTMLIASVAEGAAPDDIFKVDLGALDRYAKKIKKEVEVPGMEAYEDVKSTY